MNASLTAFTVLCAMIPGSAIAWMRTAFGGGVIASVCRFESVCAASTISAKKPGLRGIMRNVDAGWVKVHRCMLDWRWFTDGNTLKVWIWILLKANIKPHGFEGITVNRGQLATSYASIASQTKMTYDQARTAISHLRSTGEITVQRMSNFLVISIVNYNSYQCFIPDLNTDTSQSNPNHFPITSQQSKNEKNERMIRNAWENKLNVPEDFRGRFPDADSYLAFMEREG